MKKLILIGIMVLLVSCTQNTIQEGCVSDCKYNVCTMDIYLKDEKGNTLEDNPDYFGCRKACFESCYNISVEVN